MRILLLGANGFIGRAALAGLRAAGHQPVAAVRRPAALLAIDPTLETVAIDLNRDTSATDWLPRLVGIDAVVNCAGVLTGGRNQSIEAIHTAGPIALFEACAASGLRRVIQVSAISAGADTAYARTKSRADGHLAGLDLDWVVLRPSLVVGRGAYGGTALFRALAALPWFVPVPGSGAQLFQPITMDDLMATILRLLEEPTIARRVVDPVGPEPMRLDDLILLLRRWLGMRPAPLLRLPVALLRPVAWLGERLGGGPVTTTALDQLAYGNAAPVSPFTAATGIVPRPLAAWLAENPASQQDRWHARLYFLRPLLGGSLGLLWIVSGLVGLAVPADRMMAATGLDGPAATMLALAGCVLDLGLGLLVLRRWRPGLLAALQLALVAGYTLLLSATLPGLWLDPFGPLLKNLPILVAILAWAALEQER